MELRIKEAHGVQRVIVGEGFKTIDQAKYVARTQLVGDHLLHFAIDNGLERA